MARRGWVYSGPGQIRPSPYGGFSISMCTSLLPGTTYILDLIFFGFDILGGKGVHGGVQASPNSKYMGVRKL